MLKWFLLFVFAYAAYRWWARASASRPTPDAHRNDERMVVCVQCGIHFPQSEAILSDELVFCCEQHRILWKQSH